MGVEGSIRPLGGGARRIAEWLIGHQKGKEVSVLKPEPITTTFSDNPPMWGMIVDYGPEKRKVMCVVGRTSTSDGMQRDVYVFLSNPYFFDSRNMREIFPEQSIRGTLFIADQQLALKPRYDEKGEIIQLTDDHAAPESPPLMLFTDDVVVLSSIMPDEIMYASREGRRIVSIPDPKRYPEQYTAVWKATIDAYDRTIELVTRRIIEEKNQAIELAAKNAYIARLEKRVRELETQGLELQRELEERRPFTLRSVIQTVQEWVTAAKLTDIYQFTGMREEEASLRRLEEAYTQGVAVLGSSIRDLLRAIGNTRRIATFAMHLRMRDMARYDAIRDIPDKRLQREVWIKAMQEAGYPIEE